MRPGVDKKIKIAQVLLVAAFLAVIVRSQAWSEQLASLAGHANASVSTGKSVPQRCVVREIEDPHTGIHWLLVRDPKNPAGPGKLVKSTDEGYAQAISRDGSSPMAELRRSVIRAGDHLIVEEHSRVVDAQLEGTALGSAAAGDTLRVRLKIGGKVVRAIAAGPGRATLQTLQGDRL
jgi:hypothetical protein